MTSLSFDKLLNDNDHDVVFLSAYHFEKLTEKLQKIIGECVLYALRGKFLKEIHKPATRTCLFERLSHFVPL